MPKKVYIVWTTSFGGRSIVGVYAESAKDEAYELAAAPNRSIEVRDLHEGSGGTSE